MNEVILYDYWRSTASYRVRIALNILEIDFHSVTIDLLKGEQRSPEHLKRNPQGFVPVLKIDGLQLTQSMAIINDLDETRSAGLLPVPLDERARVRAIADAISMEIHPVCNPSVVAEAIKYSPDKDVARAAWMKHFIRKGLVAVESLLNDGCSGKYCHDDQISIADICLVPQCYNAQRWDVDITDLSMVSKIVEHCKKQKAFLDAYPISPNS